MIRKQAMQK